MARPTKPRSREEWRAHAQRLLREAIDAWMDAGALDGDVDAQTMVNVLAAIHGAARDGDIAALRKGKGSVEAWAKSYVQPGAPVIYSGTERIPYGPPFPGATHRAYQARRLVTWMARRVERYRGDPADPWERLRRHDAASELVRWVDVGGLYMAGIVDLRGKKRDALVESMANAVRSTAKNPNADAHAFARAILRGLGLTVRQAENVIKTVRE